jgi:hypothetical protein
MRKHCVAFSSLSTDNWQLTTYSLYVSLASKPPRPPDGSRLRDIHRPQRLPSSARPQEQTQQLRIMRQLRNAPG